MNEMLKPKIMLEATRLTRAGRLTDATALLQRMLRGETAPNMHFGGASDVALAGRTPSIIDAKAETIDETDRPLFGAATSAPAKQFRWAPRFIRPRQASLARPSVDPGHCAGGGKVH